MKKKSIFLILLALVVFTNPLFANTKGKIFRAINRGDIKTVKRLIRTGVNINSYGSDVVTFLHAACWNGERNIVSFLLKKGADPNIYDYHHKSPLMTSYSKGYKEIVKILLKNGADLNFKNGVFRTTILKEAIDKNDTEMAIYFIEKGASITNLSSRGDSVLSLAVSNENKMLLKYILKKDPVANRYSNFSFPILESINKGNYEITKMLMDHGADPKISDWRKVSTLHLAAKSGNLKLIKLFIDKGVDVDIRDVGGRTPIFYAAREGHFKAVKYLIEEDADEDIVSVSKQNPLHSAAMNGSRKIATLLLDEGTDPDQVDKRGNTPLHYAIRKKKIEFIKALLPEISYNDDFIGNNSYLHYASGYGNVKIVKLLVERGIKINRKNQWGKTSLHVAVTFGKPKILKYLVEKGGDASIRDRKGNTPLHIASTRMRPDCFQVLIDSGMNINIKNKQGRTPYSLYYPHQNYEDYLKRSAKLKRILEKYNAKK